MVASSFIVLNDLCNRRVCPQGPTYQTNRHYYPTQNNLVSHITTQVSVIRPQNYLQELSRRDLKAQFTYIPVFL